MKIVLLSGEPATGKSTLARAVMGKLGLGIPFKDGLVCGTKHHKWNVDVMGIYGSGYGFWGTDRLSMAVLPALKLWIKKQDQNARIFMEGDRVTSLDFARWLNDEYNYTGISLIADPATIAARHRQRKDSQSDSFLKGRRTKINSLVDARLLSCVPHITAQDTSSICDYILKALGIP